MNEQLGSAPPHPEHLNGRAPLVGWGVIRARGEDAAAFLHGQLTQDFALLGLSEARLAAYCSPKGRMLASFIGFKAGHDDILLLCPSDVLAAALKRLSMFVLRAKVKLSDASSEYRAWGVTGEAIPDALPHRPWAHTALNDGHWVRLYPSSGVARAIAVVPAAGAEPSGAALDPSLWDWLEVNSGIAPVTQPVVDAFVPQMLNYESVGGVNFKKGCYPGQEVVARSQFRGTLKRRAFLVHSDAEPRVGQPVFHDSDAEQPCGTVAAAARHPVAGFDAIVSMQVSASDGGALTLGDPAGPALARRPLPYELLADI